MNNEIKFIIDELGVIYGFYQDKFSLKRIKTYILSMPEGTKIVKVSLGQIPMYDHQVNLPFQCMIIKLIYHWLNSMMELIQLVCCKLIIRWLTIVPVRPSLRTRNVLLLWSIV